MTRSEDLGGGDTILFGFRRPRSEDFLLCILFQT